LGDAEIRLTVANHNVQRATGPRTVAAFTIAERGRAVVACVRELELPAIVL
jgi:hypothetical protein